MSAEKPTGALELLMDIEIPIQIRFGKTQMMLREVLALEDGSAIEFHRPPEEPADVLVNGRVVARGTVVAVQNNYAVRITEVAEQAATGNEGKAS